MALYALGDLHLGFGLTGRSRGLTGGVWKGHEERIRRAWLETVRDEDTVVLTGDFSFGKNLEQCRPDFDFILGLPGRKILLRGNHDLFWDAKKTARLNEHFAGKLFFLQDNFAEYRADGKAWALVGTKGYCFENLDSLEHFEKIQQRELERLETSFRLAREAGHRRFLMFLHYPPTSSIWPPTPELCRALGMPRRQEQEIRRQERELHLKRGGDNSGHNLVLDLKKLPRELRLRTDKVTQLLHSPFTELAEQYGAEQVIYSHCHGRERFTDSLSGEVRGIRYRLVSGDFVDFRPVKLLD